MDGMRFESLQKQEISLSWNVRTYSWVHPTSYPVGTRVLSPWRNVTGGWSWRTIFI